MTKGKRHKWQDVESPLVDQRCEVCGLERTRVRHESKSRMRAQGTRWEYLVNGEFVGWSKDCTPKTD